MKHFKSFHSCSREVGQKSQETYDFKDVNSELNSKKWSLLFSKYQLSDEHTLDTDQDMLCFRRLSGTLPTLVQRSPQIKGNLTMNIIKLYTYIAQNKFWGENNKFVLKGKGRKEMSSRVRTTNSTLLFFSLLFARVAHLFQQLHSYRIPEEGGGFITSFNSYKRHAANVEGKGAGEVTGKMAQLEGTVGEAKSPEVRTLFSHANQARSSNSDLEQPREGSVESTLPNCLH